MYLRRTLSIVVILPIFKDCMLDTQPTFDKKKLDGFPHVISVYLKMVCVTWEKYCAPFYNQPI